ncbi:MAG: 30S ribosomal protein S4e [Candidatus Thermoplasmatota archaeon]
MKRHLKRLAIPRSWGIKRKVGGRFAVKPSPGAHSIDTAIPLLHIIRDVLMYCDNAREGKRIISSRGVMVDGMVTTDYKRGIGLMDVLSFEKTKENYRALIDRNSKIKLCRISPDEAKWKLVKIVNKKILKGGKIQLNLHDGRNILVDKKDYKTGDVLKIELPKQKILDTFKLEGNNIAYITGGKHVGELAHITKLEITKSTQPNIVKMKEGFSIIFPYVFVVGSTEPLIKPPEVVR